MQYLKSSCTQSKSFLKALALTISTCILSGCLIFPLKQSDPNQALWWCPPLPNCASTESLTFVHSIQPYELIMPYEEAWPLIRESVISLQGADIEHEYPGYIYAKTYTKVFQFLDYFEVLYLAQENRLNVRSSSLLGITDFFANYVRSEDFRASLVEKGVIKPKTQ